LFEAIKTHTVRTVFSGQHGVFAAADVGHDRRSDAIQGRRGLATLLASCRRSDTMLRHALRKPGPGLSIRCHDHRASEPVHQDSLPRSNRIARSGNVRHGRDTHLPREERRMRSCPAKFGHNSNHRFAREMNRVGRQQPRGDQHAVRRHVLQDVRADTGQCLQQLAAEIRDVVATIAHLLARHRAEPALPTTEHALDHLLGIDQLLLEFLPQVLSERRVAEHRLVGPEDQRQVRVQFRLDALRRPPEIGEHFFHGTLDAAVLVLDLVRPDVVPLQVVQDVPIDKGLPHSQSGRDGEARERHVARVSRHFGCLCTCPALLR
jgi:hypothetical protein